MKKRTYICIDLKSFYASVECVERGLDPMRVNLVVADRSRTEKTICLAVSPTLKKYGLSGRARLFEVVQKVEEENRKRKEKSRVKRFAFESYDSHVLDSQPEAKISYIIAPPRMALYMEYSTRIYEVYLKYIAPEDIHVYSIDEVFMDVTDYLKTYNLSARALVKKIIQDVFKTTGITAVAGIGTNLFLAKVAMDIVSKHVEADEDGVRIAELDEKKYREELWSHRPITDFWRVGRGYAKRLESIGLYTMGDIAKCSLGKETDFYNEDRLYNLFGINAELLIDHAWGIEPCTIKEIKAYKPSAKSIGSGQVLHCPYTFEKARLIVREMTELLSLDLVEKGLVTDQIVLTIGYDIENLSGGRSYSGEITTDAYGRKVPKSAHKSVKLKEYTSSTKMITDAVIRLYDQITDKNLLVRRINLSAERVIDEKISKESPNYEQLDLFTDYEKLEKEKKRKEIEREKERSIQEAMLGIKRQFGKNAVLKGMNLEEDATTIERNKQIGGHKA